MLSKEKTRQAFTRAASQYDQYAAWQQSLARLLFEQIKVKPGAVLDLGCGTGELAFLIKSRFSRAEIHGIDLAEGMITAAEKRSMRENKPEIIFQVGDMEKINYPDESFDLVISNLSIQWLNDPKICFQEVARVLKPEGLFLFTTIGRGSQEELNKAYKKTFRKFPQQHIFKSTRDIQNALKKQKFKEIKLGEYKETLYFPTLKDLIYSMKNVGAKAQASPFLTKKDLIKFEINYTKNPKGLPLTYKLIFGEASMLR